MTKAWGLKMRYTSLTLTINKQGNVRNATDFNFFNLNTIWVYFT